MADSTATDQPSTFQEQATRRVSFILTTRNRVQLIGKALDMARHLVGPEDELIVVDGASTDGATEIIASYGDLVDVFVSEPDANPSHALNKGMLLARGKYIKHLTDDDEFYPAAIQQAVEVLEAHPEVDVLVCGGTRQVGDRCDFVYVAPGSNYGESTEDLFRFGACGCGFVMRRSALSRVGLMNTSGVATDGEFITQAIANKAQVRFCRINMFHHPIFDYSAVVDQKRAWELDMDRIARQYCSPAFYTKYKARNVIVRNPVLRRPALIVRLTFRAAMAALGIRRSHGNASVEEPIWDGGFS